MKWVVVNVIRNNFMYIVHHVCIEEFLHRFFFYDSSVVHKEVDLSVNQGIANQMTPITKATWFEMNVLLAEEKCSCSRN